jgi:hypothetical protein
MNQPSDRIAAAVATCLKHAALAERPLELAGDLALLLKGAGWNAHDIGQIEERVKSSLMRRRATDGSTDCATCAPLATDPVSLPPGGIERRRNRTAPSM